ncbi:putative cysteine-rich receptor-like protein kinase 30 [Vitis vinifera]|uniref:Putative cysteine-rich receptor-like protein kinase 30 n=1 Tax=Vitis vinifera TaxID=29760 RepID=A0A438HU34_VITVI|nr:putative cysteine-rich receptor-like protein kinase 30 [Vitis vinifera]
MTFPWKISWEKVALDQYIRENYLKETLKKLRARVGGNKKSYWDIPCTLLEILSGRKSHSNYHYEHPVNLAGYAWKLWEEGKALELVDQALDGSYPNSIVIRCIHIALLCVQENPMDRPTMTDIVAMLGSESEVEISHWKSLEEMPTYNFHTTALLDSYMVL